MDMIRNYDNEYNSVMIFGHNPDFTDLVNTLSKTPIDNIPTAGVVTLEIQFDTIGRVLNRKNLDDISVQFSRQG